ncbi:MAG: hypothetical protein A2Y67_02265 [Candidatus Buchananbacteria bacterium RBG_13_39_9]|uniref:Uncharacterized protein n=1 Tax=Candidatus Buchananbacteria bacterium RBG_13_39_9 TaxID=1797531 RepID=A0A1G1XMJ3_9BACT|nr:MAG: hypothetical protein A2Y67_02265 [Candidatus Buchananbacteria bacterium RBG_13_39_9]
MKNYFLFANKIKRFSSRLLLVLILIILNFLTAQPGIAAEPPKTWAGLIPRLKITAGKAGYAEGDYTTIVANVINAMLGLVGAIFFILIIYGGFMWMISRGEDDKVKKARNIIVYAVIGLIIVAAAYAITSLVAGWT